MPFTLNTFNVITMLLRSTSCHWYKLTDRRLFQCGISRIFLKYLLLVLSWQNMTEFLHWAKEQAIVFSAALSHSEPELPCCRYQGLNSWTPSNTEQYFKKIIYTNSKQIHRKKKWHFYLLWPSNSSTWFIEAHVKHARDDSFTSFQ